MYLYLFVTKDNIYLMWRLIDGIVSISYGTHVILSVMFIQEIKRIVLNHTGIRSYSDSHANENGNHVRIIASIRRFSIERECCDL
uniref:AC transposase n=1 Tax=Rhabditophanes sp. KR3021 TaxID=114890 RepID=A0AC35TT78_9BILA